MKILNLFRTSLFPYQQYNISDNPSFTCTANRLSFSPAARNGREHLMAISQAFKAGLTGINVEIEEKPGNQIIGGVKFDTLEIQIPMPEYTISSRNYCVFLKEYALNFSLTCKSMAGIEMLNKILYSFTII